MSLRAKLLGLFAALALAPLVALGLFDYARSKAAVRGLIADQTSIIADRLAEQLGQRLQVLHGDLELLARNAETERFYSELRSSDSGAIARATDSVRAYFADAWRVLGGSYDWVELRDAHGRSLLRSGRPTSDFDGSIDTPTVSLSVPVATDDGRIVGSLEALLKVDGLLPPALVGTRFGRAGYTLITREDGQPIYEAGRPRSPHAVPRLAGSTRTIAYTEHDTLRVASVAFVKQAPLAVVSSGAVPEFAPSLARVSVVNLLLVLAVAGILGIVFLLITRRVTRPLETLTDAATEVGRGNFAPELPSAGRDEVGRLTTAFATMSGHIDQMMAELETSRHMAAVGSFARQIAHEIRNPLTSIKLNMQSLERDARDGVVGPDNRRTLEICLGEIDRLDRVVRGVLKLARPSAAKRELSLAGVVSRAVDVVRPQLLQQRVQIEWTPPDSSLAIRGDEEQLVAMFLNLFVNAAEAMRDGGRLTVSVATRPANGTAPMVRVTISDTGPGIPVETRQRVFDPFFTTKRDGSGLGLALALRDAELHGGKLALLDAAAGERGASFEVELPIAQQGGGR